MLDGWNMQWDILTEIRAVKAELWQGSEERGELK
jgi:hypothetical protein